MRFTKKIGLWTQLIAVGAGFIDGTRPTVVAGREKTAQGGTSMRAIGHASVGAVAALWIAQAFVPAAALAAWEPTRPVEFIVPAGTGGDQQVRRSRRRGLPRREGRAQQSAQAHHHAVEPLHDSSRDRHSLQLE